MRVTNDHHSSHGADSEDHPRTYGRRRVPKPVSFILLRHVVVSFFCSQMADFLGDLEIEIDVGDDSEEEKEKAKEREENSGGDAIESLKIEGDFLAGGNGQSFFCPVLGCGKKFEWNASLKRHINNEHKNKRYKCNQPKNGKNLNYQPCGREFHQKETLNGHIRAVHTHEYLQCQTCAYKNAYAANLRAHYKKEPSHRK